MTKLILLCLLVSTHTFAQKLDELTLESTTAPSIVEDGTDLSLLPSDEPVESPDTVDFVEAVNPKQDIPAELPNTAPIELTGSEDVQVTDAPEGAVEEAPIMETPVTEMADSTTTEETPTVNPLSDFDKRPPEPTPETEVSEAPAPSVATPVITTEAPKDDRYLNHYKSHWLTTFGFEGMKYNLPFDFDGAKRNIKERDQEIWGARVGFGGQIYLGAGFFTTSKLEAFYLGTLFTKAQVSEDVDGVEAGSIKRTSGYYGGDIAQQLGYIFEFRTKNPFLDEWAYLTFEPFVEVGMGIGQSYNKVNYHYDTGTAGSGVQEDYRRTIRDQLTNARVGGGFNLTARSGFFFQARVSVNRYDITKRKIDTYQRNDDDPTIIKGSTTDKNAKMDPVTVFTIGGGYKF